MTRYYRLLFIVALAWMPCSLKAQVTSTVASIGIDAKVIAPITIENTGSTSMDFGTITRSTEIGYVTVTPGGERTASGGADILTSSDFTAAPFSVSGEGDAAFNITLPANNTVVLTRQGYSETMAVNGFAHNSTLTLSNGGTESFSVGATLTVGESQNAGVYSGSFSVTVAYQ